MWDIPESEFLVTCSDLDYKTYLIPLFKKKLKGIKQYFNLMSNKSDLCVNAIF